MNKPSKETTNSSEPLLLDKPIQLDSEDKLERSKIVDAIKNRITNHTSKESITIGIEGSWGSGKTSIINLVLNKFDKNWRDINRHDITHYVGNWIVNRIKLYWTCISIHMNFYSYKSKKLMIINSIFVHNKNHGNKKHDFSNNPLIIFFNPWNYSNNEQILNDFFRSIHSAIKKEDRGIARKFRKNASKYVPNIMDSKTLGIGGSLSIWPFGVSARFSKTIAQKPVYESKGLLDRTLQRLDKKIIVIIDDIDRLDADETLLIFKLTKIVADFPNMVFILAYDKDKTIQKINTRFEGNAAPGESTGDNFIDKIVQYHFHIPKTDILNYGKYSTELFKTIGKSVNIETWDNSTWDPTYSYYWYVLLHTPRSIKQYINNIRIRLSIIDVREIYLLDFLLIEIVRICAVDVYNYVYDSKLKLIHIGGMLLENKGHSQKNHESLLKEISDKAPIAYRDIIMRILLDLFPLNEIGYFYDLRISSEDHFDKYFTMSLDPHNISETEIETLRNKLSEGSNAFIEYTKKFKGIQYINRLRVCKRIINDIENNDYIRLTNLLLGLWELSENGVWPLKAPDIHNVARDILEKLDYDDRKKSLLTAIENENIICSDLYFLTILSKPELINSEEQKRQKELLSSDDIDVLRSRCIKKLESESKTPELLTNRSDFHLILELWYDYEKENKLLNGYKNFALKLLESKDALIKLLRYFYTIMTIPPNIKRNDLSKHFDDITVVDQAVAKLDKNKLTEEERKIVDMYDIALNSSL